MVLSQDLLVNEQHPPNLPKSGTRAFSFSANHLADIRQSARLR